MLKLALASLKIGESPARDGLLFFGLTVVASWFFWIPGALLQLNDIGIGTFFIALGSFMPMLMAFLLNYLAGQKTFEWARWLRTLNFRNISVVLLLPVLLLTPIILYRLYNGSFDLLQFFSDLGGLPFMLPGLFVLAFGEEVGWRGYLLGRLGSGKLFLVNFIVAFAWWFWQIPLVLAQPHDVFLGDPLQHLAAFLLFSILITPFFNRLSLHSEMNVLLPALARAALTVGFALYELQGSVDLRTSPYGIVVLAWLALLNLLLFAQLWQGKPSWEESELARVMPLEPVTK